MKVISFNHRTDGVSINLSIKNFISKDIMDYQI